MNDAFGIMVVAIAIVGLVFVYALILCVDVRDERDKRDKDGK